MSHASDCLESFYFVFPIKKSALKKFFGNKSMPYFTIICTYSIDTQDHYIEQFCYIKQTLPARCLLTLPSRLYIAQLVLKLIYIQFKAAII